MFANRNPHLPLLLALIFLLAACGAQEDAAGVSQASSTEERSLVIYSGRSESLVGPLIEQFADETGIDVEVRYGGTAELAATLLEEGDNSPADVFYAQDPGGLGAVAAAGMLATLPDSILSDLPAAYTGQDGKWIGVSGRARVVVYNTDRLTVAELPADLWGFLEPEWRGEVGWAPTNGSFQAMVTALRAEWGEAQTRRWLEGMQANDPVVFEGNTPIVAAVGAGEISAGLVNHYYLYRFLAEEGEGFAARNYVLPEGGPGSIVLVSGAGILETASNGASAELFLAYLLSPAAQEYFATETYEYPVTEGVPVSPLVTLPDELSLAANQVPLEQLADLQGTVEMLSELNILP
jgi:iron(III) transport system substrate-binding protein